MEFVGAGAAAANTGNTSGRSISPAVPAGVQAGDVLVIYLVGANHPTLGLCQITTPSGWTALLADETSPPASANFIFVKTAGGSESAPSISVGTSGGEKAQMVALRGVTLPVDDFQSDSTQSSASTSQLQWPSVTPTAGSSIVLAFGTSNFTWTSASASSGFTLISQSTNVRSMVWQYKLHSGTSAVPSGLFTYSGASISAAAKRGFAAVFPSANEAPTAAAGSDQTVWQGDTVNLDGSASSDPDAVDSITYSWTVLDDGGTGLTTGDLTGANTATPSFTAPDPGTNRFLEFYYADGDRASVAHHSSLNVNAHTVVARVRLHSGGSTEYRQLMFKNPGLSWHRGLRSDGIGTWYDQSLGNWVISGMPGHDNQWHEVVYSYDPAAGANNQRVYVDGVLKNQRTVAGDWSVGTGALSLLYADFDGDVADLRLYDRQLSAGEVVQLWNGRPVDSGLVSRWKFDEGSGATLSDSVGSNHGALTGGTWDTADADTMPPEPYEIVLQLEVEDESGATDTDTVTITVVPNQAPTADAGEDQNGREGDTIDLDGTGSSDPDGDTLTYAWTVVDADGTGLTTGDLVDADTATPSFEAPAPSGVVALDSIASPAGTPAGLTFDGAHLWHSDLAETPGDLFKIDPATGSVVSTTNPISVPYSIVYVGDKFLVGDTAFAYQVSLAGEYMFSAAGVGSHTAGGMAFDGTDLWVCDGSTIYRRDIDDYSLIDSFAAPSATTTGIAWDGEKLWAADGTANVIRAVDPDDGTVLSTIPGPGTAVGDLAFDGEFLWAVDTAEKLIYKVNRSPNQASIVLQLEVTDPAGLTDTDTVTVTTIPSALIDFTGTGGAEVGGAATVEYLDPDAVSGSGGLHVGGAATVEDLTFEILAEATMSGGLLLGGHAEASKLSFEVHEPAPPAVHLPVYEAVLVARVPALSGVPELVVVDRLVTAGLSYTDELNRPGTASLGCPVRSLSAAAKERLANLAQFPSEVWIYRDDVLAWAGEIQTLQVQGQTLTINCAGLLGYTRRMGVTEDLVFTDEDQFTIAKALVDHWQALPQGHYAIDTGEIGTSGVTRDRTYLRDELHNIGQRLEELGAVENGFDMHVDPATRKLVLSYPQRGLDLSSSVFFDERNIDSAAVALSVGPDDLVTDGSFTGTLQSEAGENTVTYAARENLALRGTYGRSWAGVNFSNISVAETVVAHGDEFLAARDGMFFQPGVTIMPRPGADVGDFHPGDTVSYSYDAGLGLQSGAYRVAKVTVSVDEGGEQRIGVEFT